MPVFFRYTNRSYTLRSTKLLKVSVQKVFEQERVFLERLEYIICSDEFLLGINSQYLGHHDFTDIITFDLTENDKGVIGEIYISAERVKENAKIYAVPYSNELKRVILHGALHLCGYKDKTKLEKEQMRLKEEHYLLL